MILGARPPAFVLLSHFWLKVFGTTEFAARCCLCRSASGRSRSASWWGRSCSGARVGILAAWFLALSEFQIFHSQEFRYYTLFIFTSLLSYVFFIRLLRTPSRKSALTYVLASALLFYSHSFGFFVIMAQNLHVLTRWRQQPQFRWPWVLSQAVLLALISPGLVVTTLTVTGTIGVMTWVPAPSIWQPMKTIGKFVFPNLTPLAEGDIVRIGLAGLAWFTIAMAGVLVWRRGQSRVAMPEMSLPGADVASAPGHLRLTLLWLACPLLLPLVLSKVFEPFYVDRYSICAAPVVLPLALAVVRLERTIPVLVSISTFVILVTPGLLGYYSTTLKGEWRDVAAYVSQHTEDSDVILVIDDDQGSDTKAFSWYYAGGAQNVRAIDSALTSPGHTTDVVERYAQHHQRLRLVVANPGTPVADFLLGAQNQALRLVQSTTFHPRVVALFDVQPALGSIGP